MRIGAKSQKLDPAIISCQTVELFLYFNNFATFFPLIFLNFNYLLIVKENEINLMNQACFEDSVIQTCYFHLDSATDTESESLAG